MFKNIFVSTMILLIAIPMAFSADVSLTQEQQQKALQALESSNSAIAKSLSESEKVVLKATLALQNNALDKALTYLNHEANKHDPLIALLEAEVYRRSAIQAVARAGDYAKALGAEKQQLENASLANGLVEANARLNSFLDSLEGMNGQPMDLLALGSDIRSVFFVDKKRSRMFVYERNAKGELQRIADEYVVTGASLGDKQKKGDARTPNGVYRFVERLDDKNLEARYGPVAFPIDYPNALDRLHQKDGSGIWMHGYASNVERRPSRDTRGCFALPNSRLLAIAEHVQLQKSWVVVGEDFIFDAPKQQYELKQSVEQAINSWKKDWVSLNTKAYLKHYHQKFRSGERDLAAWRAYKTRVNNNKTYVKVDFSNMTLVRDPAKHPEGEVVVAEFDQRYDSNNYQDVSRKRLYLVRASEHKPWKILVEESVEP